MAHGLQNRLSDTNPSVRSPPDHGYENGDRVADAFLEQDSHGALDATTPFDPHVSFSQAEVQRFTRTGCESSIRRSIAVPPLNLRAQDDLVRREAAFLRQRSGVKSH